MSKTTLSPTEKAERARQRMIETAKQYQTGTYSRRFVAPLYQRMRRAEFAAEPAGECPAIVNGEIESVYREVGQCVCVTCGKVQAWASGLEGIHTGHFIASRSNSILYEDDNTAPSCSRCNVYCSGEQQLFRKWMLATRGIEVIERLERLKTQSVSFTREQLVDMRISFQERLRAAEERMKTF